MEEQFGLGMRAAVDFYAENYAWTEPFFLRPGNKITLGERKNRICRFCNRPEPEVSFRLNAHAIPELLGNKSIFTNYECDECNGAFGRGIENDLGNWSKPLRTFARIRGKNGVPKMKREGPGGWRVEYQEEKLQIKAYEKDPFYVVDEENKRITFKLMRDPYTPVAVLKAFVKIGLTLMPEDELGNFPEALSWIKETDHSKGLVKEFPVFKMFQWGPMPNDLIVFFLLRRKSLEVELPYSFLVLAYGNEVFQVVLPCPKKDNLIDGKKINLPLFPVPGGPDPDRYGQPKLTVLDLTGREVIRGETTEITFGFDELIRSEPDKG